MVPSAARVNRPPLIAASSAARIFSASAPVHFRPIAHYPAAVMSFRFAGCGIGQVDVVVDFPAAGLGGDHSASLITRTSACHETCFLRWNCCSAFDFAQTRDEELSPSRKRRPAGEFWQLFSRPSVTTIGSEFF